jgi:hypothetical protein
MTSISRLLSEAHRQLAPEAELPDVGSHLGPCESGTSGDGYLSQSVLR